MPHRFIFLLVSIFLLSLIFSCTPAVKTYNIEGNYVNLKNNLLLLPSLTLKEVISITNEKEIFYSNLYIGAIHFSGGYIVNSNENMMIQSKEIKFSKEEDFENNIKNVLTEALINILDKNKINLIYIKDFKVNYYKPLIIVETKIDKEISKKDGTDNINLPRIIYKYNGININFMSNIRELYSQRYILIPIIQYYYAHNAGWFNDQRYGCSAGARLHIDILIYDILNNKLIYKYSDTQSKIYDLKFQLSLYEMERDLYILEKNMISNLTKEFSHFKIKR